MTMRTYLIPDESMPRGHDWLRVDRDDGESFFLIRASTVTAMPVPDSDAERSGLLTRQHLSDSEACSEGAERQRSALGLVV